MEKEYSGSTVSVDQEGYLTDFTCWNRQIAAEIAKEENIELSDKHWEVIDYIQACHRDGKQLTIRSIGKNGPCSIKEFYALFPEGPLKKASRIAGIPKPVGCI